MNVIETSIPKVLIVEPAVFSDERGFFLESYHRLRYESQRIDAAFVQDNLSRSTKNVLRGLHCQIEHSQGKLVSVVRGSVFDVAVDIRRGSPTFGKWVGVILDDENHRQLYIPPGFAHGFCVLSKEVDFTYKCTDYYHVQTEIGIRWDDPVINIEWPVKSPLLSPKDQKYPFLSDINPSDFPVYEIEEKSSPQ